MANHQIIHVDGLSKYYQVPVREAGLKASLKSLFKREYNEIKAVDQI
ncbi:MAG: ABC transporter, partial [Anaerolineaceae bacterium]|nr:ABC transporter [Anaerolineaceae bacterium]